MPSPCSLPARIWQKLIGVWDSAQVELHGCYSVQRMYDLHAYSQRTTGLRTVLVVLLTPLPCLIAVAFADCIPLRAPSEGIAHSAGFWARALFATWVYAYSVMEQMRYFIPTLPLSGWMTLGLSIPVAVATNIVTFILAWKIAYPLPFTIPALSMPWSTFMVVSLWFQLRAYFRANPEKLRELMQFLFVAMCQMSMLLIYPAYNSVFYNLSSTQQMLFALLLPVIKLFEKNALSFFMHHLDDLKPEWIIFNVEIFNALFIACCIQNANSLGTNVVLVAVDFSMACISLRDLDLMLAEVHALAKKLNISTAELLQSAIVVAQRYPRLERVVTQRLLDQKLERIRSRRRSSLHRIIIVPVYQRLVSFLRPRCTRKTRPTPTMPIPEARAEASAVEQANRLRDARTLKNEVDVGVDTSVQLPSKTSNAVERNVSSIVLSATLNTIFPEAPTPNYADTVQLSTTDHRPVAVMDLMNDEERTLFLEKSLQVLHFTEYLLLIEYTEVMIPIVYCAYWSWLLVIVLFHTLTLFDSYVAIYLSILFFLPNRQYYPQLKDMDDDKLRRTITNVMLNAIFELLSLVLLAFVLRKKLNSSPFQQLAFVLDRQWRMVQSKVVLWVVVTLQSTLYHLGADYSFKFAWLHETNPNDA